MNTKSRRAIRLFQRLVQACLVIVALALHPTRGLSAPAEGAAAINGTGKAAESQILPPVFSRPALPVPFQPQPGGDRVPALPGSIEDPLPRTGDQKILVVLVDFPDKAGDRTGTAWQQFFWGTGGFSDYYKENTYNQLRYTGDIVGMSGGGVVVNGSGVAYVRLPHDITYYAFNSYGFNMRAFPQNNGGVVQHALQALNTAGFNFAPYADPQTGQVENLVVVFAGQNYGYARQASFSLEATAYSLTSAGGGPFTSTGGQVFDNYTFCPEKTYSPSAIATQGICVHEHGHALGLVDLYDLSGYTSGAGFFDLMAYGTYGATQGARPFQMSAFSKELGGWITPTVHYSGTITVTLGASETGPNYLKLYPGWNPGGTEYFLLENRQPLGFDQDWAAQQLCPGLVIWHVDRQIVANYPYSANSTTGSPAGYPPPPHQGAIVMEADGHQEMITPVAPLPWVGLNYGECADTWQVDQTWTAPASNLWGGTPSLLSLTVLSAQNNSVTVRVSADVPTYSHWLHLPLVME